MTKHILPFVVIALAGCSPEMDLQGHDPVEYYAQHPIKNTVDVRSKNVMVYIAPATGTYSGAPEDALKRQLADVSMPSVDSIQVGLSAHDMADASRKAYIAKLIRHLGYDKGDVIFEPSTGVRNLYADMTINYAVVIPPDCPDWRRSPRNTHSNTRQGNFECAQEVNVGLMVEDPHDLLKGTGDVPITTPRAAQAVQNYNSGTSTAASSSSSSSGASTSGASSQTSASSTAATPQ